MNVGVKNQNGLSSKDGKYYNMTLEEAEINIGQFVRKRSGLPFKDGKYISKVISVHRNEYSPSKVPSYDLTCGTFVEVRRCLIDPDLFDPKFDTI